MPSNKDFKMSILVGGVELPEYEKDGEVYVESNLHTPVSYMQESEELAQGEVEKQEWPVTPYQIEITAMPTTPHSQYRVSVDGQLVSLHDVLPGESWICEGLSSGANIKEFLFSLPRFPLDKEDRMEKRTASRVGTIEVKCWDCKLMGKKKANTSTRCRNEYIQANKKDNDNVTNGEYMMATTKAGRSLFTFEQRTEPLMVDDWMWLQIRSKLTVRYRMGHTLFGMGIKLRPIMPPRTNVSGVQEELVEINEDDDEVIITDVVPAKKRERGRFDRY